MDNKTEADLERFAQQYLELWNTGSEETRRRAIAELWAPDAEHVAPSIAVRGYEELEARAARSQQRWIIEEGCRFVVRSVSGHHHVVRIIWEMVDAKGTVESVGHEILILNEAGKIASVYQFIDR
jgi:hypothetical protein